MWRVGVTIRLRLTSWKDALIFISEGTLTWKAGAGAIQTLELWILLDLNWFRLQSFYCSTFAIFWLIINELSIIHCLCLIATFCRTSDSRVYRIRSKLPTTKYDGVTEHAVRSPGPWPHWRIQRLWCVLKCKGMRQSKVKHEEMHHFNVNIGPMHPWSHGHDMTWYDMTGHDMTWHDCPRCTIRIWYHALWYHTIESILWHYIVAWFAMI